jgi:hypothetical protein
MKTQIGIQETEKPGRLELAILEWQRQLVRRREAQVRATPEPVAGVGTSANADVLPCHSPPGP